MPFFLGNKATEGYENLLLTREKKGGGKRLSGRSRLRNKGAMLSSEESDGFDGGFFMF